MPIYKSTDVTMILGGLDLIERGKVAGAPLNQESTPVDLPALGDKFSDTRPGAPTVAIPLDVYADDGTLGVLTRIKALADGEAVPLSYGVQGGGSGKRVWHFPSVGISGYGVTPTLGGYTRATATLSSDSDAYYPNAIIVNDWTDVTGTGQATTPAPSTDGVDSEPDGAYAVHGVDVVREGGKDYLVFGTASGARVPVTKADDKWLIYVASGTATWTDRTVTVAASETGRAEITAGLTTTQRTAFDAAQTAGAVMAAKPVETHDGASVVWYVESATFGARARMRFRLWERAGTSGTWGAARAYGNVAHDATLPIAVETRTDDNPVLRYVVCTHSFDQGADTGDDSLRARFRCEFIRHMRYTQL